MRKTKNNSISATAVHSNYERYPFHENFNNWRRWQSLNMWNMKKTIDIWWLDFRTQSKSRLKGSVYLRCILMHAMHIESQTWKLPLNKNLPQAFETASATTNVEDDFQNQTWLTLSKNLLSIFVLNLFLKWLCSVHHVGTQYPIRHSEGC